MKEINTLPSTVNISTRADKNNPVSVAKVNAALIVCAISKELNDSSLLIAARKIVG